MRHDASETVADMSTSGFMIIADDGAVGYIAVDHKKNLPISAVGGEKAETHASLARRFGVISHFFGPVFVVADREESAMFKGTGTAALIAEQVCVLMQVEAGAVGDVIALAFEPAHHVRFPAVVEEKAASFDLKRAIERDLERPVVEVEIRRHPLMRSAASDEVFRAVKGVAAPGVVGLICCDAEIEEDVREGIIIADHKYHVAEHAVRAGEFRQIDAAGPGGGFATWD